MKTVGIAFLLLLSPGLTQAAESRSASPTPLPRAHAHNDYEHERPLLDALAHGFCGIEADVHLVEGELLVAHDREDVKPGRTLESLYLDPLRERVRANGGRVYPNGPTVLLLVDVKGAAEPTYRVLKDKLAPYAGMLTRFRDGRIETNAVTVVISGNRATSLIRAEADRFAAMDGRLPDLEGDAPPAFIPLVSDNWNSHFRWRGTGEISPEEREKLRTIVHRAHAQGRQIRWWATPDRVEAWRELDQAGVDWINTDNLGGLREYLLRTAPVASGNRTLE